MDRLDAQTVCTTNQAMESKNNSGIPQKALDVSGARYQLTRLFDQLRGSPRAYLITQSGRRGNLTSLGKKRQHLGTASQGKVPGASVHEETG
jgi:hypothetical protein